MKPTINIYSPDGTLLLTPIITKEAEVRQALMADDHVTLSWNDIQCDTLPAGTYICTWRRTIYIARTVQSRTTQRSRMEIQSTV